MTSGQTIDKNTWERREIFDFFSMSHPFYAVCFNIEVTPLFRFCKERGLSFYHSMIYLCTEAINAVPAFLYGAKDGVIMRFERRIPSFTHLEKGSELFKIITLPCEGSLDDFCRGAAEKCAEQKAFIDPAAEGSDLIYVSCLPWLDLTALTNEHDISDPAHREDSIPRLAWGKLKDADGKKYLNLSVEVNHRFIDGVHIGRFAQKLEELIASLQ